MRHGVFLRFAFVAACLLLALPAFGGEVLQYQVVPKWQGLAKIGRVTEVEIRLIAANYGKLQVELADGVTHTVKTARLKPNEPEKVILNFRPMEENIDINLIFRGQVYREKLALSLLPAKTKVLATVVPSSVSAGVKQSSFPLNQGESGDWLIREFSLDDIPTHHQAYQGITAVFLPTLSVLEAPGEAALSLATYIKYCGLVVAGPKVTEVGISSLQHWAGCGAENIYSPKPSRSSNEDIVIDLKALEALRYSSNNSRPSLEALLSLAGQQQSLVIPLLVVSLCGYLLFLLGNCIWQRKHGLFILPVMFSALVIVIFKLTPMQVSEYVWLEKRGAQSSVSFSSLFKIVQPGFSTANYSPVSSMGLPLLDLGESSKALIQAEGSEDRQGNKSNLNIQLSSASYLSATLYFSGVLNDSAAAKLNVHLSSFNNEVLIVNDSTTPLSSGILSWNGAYYWLPRVEALSRRQVSQDQLQIVDNRAPTAIPAEVTRLFRQRSVQWNVAMLYRFNLSDDHSYSGIGVEQPPKGGTWVMVAETPYQSLYSQLSAKDLQGGLYAG